MTFVLRSFYTASWRILWFFALCMVLATLASSCGHVDVAV